MKKLLVILITLVLIVIAGTACRTTSNPSGIYTVGGQPIDPIKTGQAVQIAAKYGALETIHQKPETRQYFQLSAAAIATVIASGNYNPTNVTASLNNLTGSAQVSSAVSDALTIYSAFVGDLVANKLNEQSPYTVPVLAGLAAGIQQAVDLTAP